MRQPAAAGELCLGWEGQAEGRAQEGKTLLGAGPCWHQVTPGLWATLRIFPLCSLARCEDQLTSLLGLR